MSEIQMRPLDCGLGFMFLTYRFCYSHGGKDRSVEMVWHGVVVGRLGSARDLPELGCKGV